MSTNKWLTWFKPLSDREKQYKAKEVLGITAADLGMLSYLKRYSNPRDAMLSYLRINKLDYEAITGQSTNNLDLFWTESSEYYKNNKKKCRRWLDKPEDAILVEIKLSNNRLCKADIPDEEKVNIMCYINWLMAVLNKRLTFYKNEASTAQTA